MKVLSILVFDVGDEMYRERCLDSIGYYRELDKYIEVILVDSLGAGIKRASGKYCCVIFSKDLFEIDYFLKYVDVLKNEESDLVLLRYAEENISNETSIMKDDFSFQAITVKTSLIKDANIESIDEFPFAVKKDTKTVSRYDFSVYRDFRIPFENMYEEIFKHGDYYENLIRKILSKYPEIFQGRKVKIIDNYYRSYLVRSKLNNIEKEKLLKFDGFLKNEYPVLHKSIFAAKMLRLRLSSLYRNVFIKYISNLRRNGK